MMEVDLQNDLTAGLCVCCSTRYLLYGGLTGEYPDKGVTEVNIEAEGRNRVKLPVEGPPHRLQVQSSKGETSSGTGKEALTPSCVLPLG